MAIAVPLIMGAMGAGTMAIAITSVAFAVTGINDKINKVAANVFGEDLVKFANVAGMAFGAYQAWSAPTGGFDMLDTGVLAQAQGEAFSANGLGDIAGEFGAAAPSTALDVALPNVVTRLDPGAADYNAFGSPEVSQTMSSAPRAAPVAQPAQTVASPVVSQSPSNFGLTTNALTSAPSPAVVNAVESGAGGASLLKAEGATNLNVMDRIKKAIIDPKTGNISQGAMTLGGAVLKGGADAYSAAKAREIAQEQFDRKWNLAERNAAAVGWRQTQ